MRWCVKGRKGGALVSISNNSPLPSVTGRELDIDTLCLSNCDKKKQQKIKTRAGMELRECVQCVLV